MNRWSVYPGLTLLLQYLALSNTPLKCCVNSFMCYVAPHSTQQQMWTKKQLWNYRLGWKCAYKWILHHLVLLLACHLSDWDNSNWEAMLANQKPEKNWTDNNCKSRIRGWYVWPVVEWQDYIASCWFGMLLKSLDSVFFKNKGREALFKENCVRLD